MKKKTILFFLAFLLLLPCHLISAGAVSQTFVAACDLDGDGRVNSVDARLLLRKAARLCVLEKTEAADRVGIVVFGDMNGSGSVTSADARLLLKYVSRKIDESAFVFSVAMTVPPDTTDSELYSDPPQTTRRSGSGESGGTTHGRGSSETAVILSEGVDVSSHNGHIDWARMADEIDWAILRCGYGSDLEEQDDKQWEYNVSSCEKLGIPYGVYLYSYADSVEKASSEADHVLRLLKGHHPQLPVYYDLEVESIAGKAPKSLFVQMAKTFCEKISAAGYEFGVYANLNWWTNYLTDPWFDGHSRWIAAYRDVLYYDGEYDIWQYSNTGRFEGAAGNIDRDRAYRAFDLETAR